MGKYKHSKGAIKMNHNLKGYAKIKLNDKDKKILISNSNICTDSHGNSCVKSEPDTKLN
jgi:hypothetical protein